MFATGIICRRLTSGKYGWAKCNERTVYAVLNEVSRALRGESAASPEATERSEGVW